MNHNKRFFAFTLSEILITLGIIGIAAAFTLPILMQQYQKKVILTQLKKNYSILQNWVRKAETAEELPMNKWPTGAEMNIDEYWDIYIKPYFAQVKQCPDMKACGYNSNYNTEEEREQFTAMLWLPGTNSTRVLFQLGDGTVIFLPRNYDSSDGKLVYVSYFYVDVNGPSGPNTYCKDVFIFRRGETKGIEPTSCTTTVIKNNYEFPADYSYWQ